MSWVPIVTDEEANPEVKGLYDYLRKRWSFVPNYFYALGRDRQSLQDQVHLFTNAMFDERPGGLPRMVKEQIALVVSGLNTSTYCLAAHMEILGKLGVPKTLGRALAMDYRSAPIEPKLMALFRFVEKLTRQPGDMAQADADRLRDAGWSDTEIFEAVLVASLYACANRFSAGLGLLPDF
jgi:uncharacterized peroxidase-related enzyme